MPSRLPWPTSYLSSLTRFISRRADRKSSPGLGERVREGQRAGVVEPSSLLLLDVAIAHPTGFQDVSIGRSWSEDSRPLHRCGTAAPRRNHARDSSCFPSCVATLAEATRP